MGWFFARDWGGPAFQIFAPYHLAALSLVLLVNISLFFWKPSEKVRVIFRYGMGTFMLVLEAGYHLWNASVGLWSPQTMLPFHLCSVLIYLSAAMLYTKKQGFYEFCYFLGIGGALQALLTPDAGAYGYPHYKFFHVMLSHANIVTAAVYMTVVEGLRPQWKSILRVFLIGNIYMAFVGVINWLLGSNYLFIAHKPVDPSLIDLMGPWPWYILGIEAMGVVTCLVLYLPFAVKDWLAARRSPRPAGA